MGPDGCPDPVPEVLGECTRATIFGVAAVMVSVLGFTPARSTGADNDADCCGGTAGVFTVALPMLTCWFAAVILNGKSEPDYVYNVNGNPTPIMGMYSTGVTWCGCAAVLGGMLSCAVSNFLKSKGSYVRFSASFVVMLAIAVPGFMLSNQYYSKADAEVFREVSEECQQTDFASMSTCMMESYNSAELGYLTLRVGGFVGALGALSPLVLKAMKKIDMTPWYTASCVVSAVLFFFLDVCVALILRGKIDVYGPGGTSAYLGYAYAQSGYMMGTALAMAGVLVPVACCLRVNIAALFMGVSIISGPALLTTLVMISTAQGRGMGICKRAQYVAAAGLPETAMRTDGSMVLLGLPLIVCMGAALRWRYGRPFMQHESTLQPTAQYQLLG
jgi:hypothetical protein